MQYEATGGAEEVIHIFGSDSSFLKNIHFSYAGGFDPHYSVDHLTASTASILCRSEDELPRIFSNNPGNYKTIASSILFGACADGDSLSLKTYFLAEIINYFLGISPITGFQEVVIPNSTLVSVYPNPFSEVTQIDVDIHEKSFVSMVVFDHFGNPIRNLCNCIFSPGIQSITWNATDEAGNEVNNGIYFYRIIIGEKMISGKLILMD